ncbi:MAG: NAD(P)/FAD-dependent oxidoreductase [Clostridiaceae bacterium]|jgi:predicted Rossmann fold flavoprotein|nr:NAD(P)/FAD-dependent oxidoreductase [Clostridiaceae bacterium]
MAKKVGIIGAGAAGLFAACRASELGSSVTVFEKNSRAGKKLLITGKGRCNITNNCSLDDLMNNIPGNGRFLYSAFNQYNNHDIMNFFDFHNVPVKTERGNRVFPCSDRASDIVKALQNYALSQGVHFLYNSSVKDIICEENGVKGILLKNNDFYEFDSVILATGGLSYSMTGSTGDGHRIAQKLGHTVSSLKPSLIPLEISETWISQLQGLTLRNVGLTAYDNKGKKVYYEQGEMLFTHFGVSGPIVLSASRHIMDCDYTGASLVIDLKPALDEETLDNRIQRDFIKYQRKQFANSLNDLLPKSLIPVIIQLSEIRPEKPVNQITKAERRGLVELLKGLKMTVSKSRSIDEAIVTAGGVLTKEINPATMESKLMEGLYFAGEIIDVDAYTGGFNLTIAFSTGYVAASHASF